MGLLEEAKSIVLEIFGPAVAEQLNSFENPEKEPEEFLKECIFFIGKLMGEDAAEKKFAPLAEKYLKTARRKIGNRYSETKQATPLLA